METIEKALFKLFNFGQTLEGALKDHKVNFIEGATLSGSLGIAFFFVIQNFKQLQEEMQELDDQKRDQLLAWFKVKVDLDNDRAERIFEDTLELILNVCKYVQTFKQ